MENNNVVLVSAKGVTFRGKGLINIEDNLIEVIKADSLEIIYDQSLDRDVMLNIIVQAQNHLDIIEKYNLNSSIGINKKIEFKEDSIINRYLQNNGTAIKIKITEDIKVWDNTQIKAAYVELNDCDVETKIVYDLLGPGADVRTRLAGLSNGRKKHYDISLLHNAQNTYGKMDNYGVVKNQGNLIIDGTGSITKGMAKSATHQTNKIIVYDKGCVAKANPYLYINEYDVKASHGASVGAINPEHLYYLKSRGLSQRDAMELVTYGYFMPIIDFINNENIKQEFEATLRKQVVV